MARPNILYLHSHDTGRYIQPYGYAVPTPNLQKFAEQSVLFRNAHCANPTCSPSRACLLTGQYAHQNGMMGLAHRGFSLNDPKKHLVHTLNAAGYQTVLGGIQHVDRLHKSEESSRQIGYERFLEHETNAAAVVADSGIKFLREKHERPFFLSLGTIETHRTFPAASPANDARYTRAPGILPDTPQTRLDWAEYCTMASQLDEAYGRILGELQAAGLAQNTIVLCTTDHGVAFPWMKCNLTDHGTGVLMMMRGPGLTDSPNNATGKVVDGMVSQLDVFPTLCELAEIPKPDWLVGDSFLPLVQGRQEELHEQLVTTVNAHASAEPMRCVRTKRHSYIRRYEDLPYRVLPNVDAGYSKTALLEQGWRDMPDPLEALYDLTLDPMERHNLADDPRYASTLADMQKRLADWQKKYDDPLAKGPLKWGPKAELNDQASTDPSK